MKFLTKYELTNNKKGKFFKKPSLTNQASEKDTNIKAMIQKYGITSLMDKEITDEMYIDTTIFDNNDINTLMNIKKNMNEYYNNLPAKIRKEFGDNFDKFYEEFKLGKYEKFVNKGIISEDTLEEIKRIEKTKKDEQWQSFVNKYKQEELAKQEAMKQIKLESGDYNEG